MKLIIIRGFPGSGKSTYAKKHYPKHIKIEADDWFVKGKEYIFDPKELSSAHTFCALKTEFYLRKGKSVVVSNTFTQYWEMIPYFELAKKYGIHCEIIEMKTAYGNIHGVPKSKLTSMKKRWDAYKIKD